MNVPTDLMYTKDHEWAKFDDNIVTVGITDFAQSELGDIIFKFCPFMIICVHQICWNIHQIFSFKYYLFLSVLKSKVSKKLVS